MRQCSVVGCDKKYFAKGLCNTHYQHQRLIDAPEFYVWKDAKRRACDPRCKAYPEYGGRGITMSREWCNSFGSFYQDMGPKPTPTHTLERIDNDGPYSKENCIWADRTAQSNNRRNNICLEYLGRTQTLAQWCTELGYDYETIRSRYHRYGELPPRLFRPVRKLRKI